MKERRRVAIAGGGTAGHVTPGIAIMLAYREAFDADVYFIGCEGGFETELVPARGFALELIPGAPYERQKASGKMKAGVMLARGILQARHLFKANKTELVIGLGGYASMGAVIAARSLGIQTAIHEANVRPGLANGVLKRFADHIFLGWEQSRTFFPGPNVHVTGNPILPEIATMAEHRQPEEQSRVLVLGGSTGSRFLNQHAPKLLARIRELGVDFSVVHQCGPCDPAAIRAQYGSGGISAQVSTYIDDIPATYRDASFAITTAGGLTLAELAAVGVPCLLVPMEAAAQRHQIANAEAFAKQSGVMWVAEQDWNVESLAMLLATLLHDHERLRDQSQVLRQMARPNAARDIACLCEELLRQI